MGNNILKTSTAFCVYNDVQYLLSVAQTAFISVPIKHGFCVYSAQAQVHLSARVHFGMSLFIDTSPSIGMSQFIDMSPFIGTSPFIGMSPPPNLR